jgi:hypothetical protein
MVHGGIVCRESIFEVAVHNHRARLIALLVVAAATAGRSAALPSSAQLLPFFYDIYTFRGAEGGTAVVTSFAVEAGRLATERSDGRTRYRYSLTLVLADTVRRTVTKTHDTVFVDVDRPFPDEHLLYTQVEVTAPPSRHTRQRVIVIDAVPVGYGQLYTEPFPVPDYSGSNLMLSDILFARPGAEAGWKRDGTTLEILPSTRFPPDVFDIYYEIYNLAAGHAYTTEIVIERLNPGTEPIRLRFTGESDAGPDGLLPELRQIDAQLTRGTFRMTVTLTDLATGEVATRSRSFQVQGSARGATRVPALQRTHFPVKR